MKKLWTFWLLCLPLLAAIVFPPLTGRVVDEADLLSPQQEARISAKLEALEHNTTDQFVVVTLKSLQGYDIADYGYRLGRRWGIGQKGKDNGVLLIVAPKEHKVRIEVGYGLEGALTDAKSAAIIRNVIVPRFKRKDFAGGIEAGVDAVVEVLRHPNAAVGTAKAEGSEKEEDKIKQWIFALFFFATMALSFIPSYKNIWISGALALIVGGATYAVTGMVVVAVVFGFFVGLIAYFGRSGGTVSTDDGFGGGFTGSFGGGFGGGGGSFGGGGASGSW